MEEEEEDLMEMFMDFSKPMKRINLASMVEMEMQLPQPRSNQNADRMYSGKEYLIEEHRKIQEDLAKVSLFLLY